MPGKRAKSGTRPRRAWRVDLIGRKGREIGFGAVILPAIIPGRRRPVLRQEAEFVAVVAYRARFPGWNWEAVCP